jgi:hypothetical protein
MAFLKFSAGSVLNKKSKDIVVYDPYYCDGSVKRHMQKLGWNCINENIDFYEADRQGR